MNIILFSKTENSHNTVTLTGRRAAHIITVIKPKLGDTLCVGELEGSIGQGLITAISNDTLTLSVSLDQPPPQPMPITLVLALPRPQMLKRSLQTIACMGVKELYLIHSNRVEKSFWQTPSLKPNAVEEQIMLGLEQAKDTVLPTVTYVKQWHTFTNEYLPTITRNKPGIVTHPGAGTHYREIPTSGNCTLLIGPEGGWKASEVEQLIDQGCTGCHLGERILKVETAVTAVLSHFL